MKKTTLIIPDIHLGHNCAEKIIKSENPDEVIFLGDYFDDFMDDPYQIRETAEWLVDSAHLPNRIHLWGNHDVHYGYKYRINRCSGYAQHKEWLIDEYVKPETWKKLKFFHILDNRWLLTHAGMHVYHLPPKIKVLYKNRSQFLKELTNHLNDWSHIAVRHMANNEEDWFSGAGRSRGGFLHVGGIYWCDFISEFSPIRGLNQIVGHTPSKTPKWANLLPDSEEVSLIPNEGFYPLPENLDNPEYSFNLCLDTKLKYYALWDSSTKELKIKSVKDLYVKKT